jgi:hypothetical protein
MRKLISSVLDDMFVASMHKLISSILDDMFVASMRKLISSVLDDMFALQVFTLQLHPCMSSYRHTLDELTIQVGSHYKTRILIVGALYKKGYGVSDHKLRGFLSACANMWAGLMTYCTVFCNI